MQHHNRLATLAAFALSIALGNDVASAQPAATSNSGNHYGLRIDISDYDTPENLERAELLGNLLYASHITNPGGKTTAAHAEETLASLHAVGVKGYAHDLPTLMLGITQTPRYSAQGDDQADYLEEAIFGKSVQSKDGQFFTKYCVYPNEAACDYKKPPTTQEAHSTAARLIDISPDMNQLRGFMNDPAMAYIMGREMGYTRPSVGTQGASLEDTAEKMRQSGHAEAVNHALAVKCLTSDESVDTKTCAIAGARDSIYDQVNNR